MKTKLLIMFTFVEFLSLLVFIPHIDAVETESGIFIWKFCEHEKQFDYKIINGTLHDTVHLKLQDTNNCENKNATDYQLQLFHTSNNQTDFTVIVPKDLDLDKIDVTVVGRDYLEYFQINDTNRIMTFSDFTHDKNGFVTVILDFKGIEN
ncbi:hypothetical protein [Nitrosarchaeum sp. AC2]|uniref:hypothetical protein n=1 Tax=Nitrosarchaeum sp. AC2 TaxID=2259673 RepID=UPI0015CCA7C5|nr:hypothetical protein [Nitrosarchaeum sp. AC2]QLH10828.1 hypothetical protein DSQ20_04595 [Nitrosarchaeum sp. AC2]